MADIIDRAAAKYDEAPNGMACGAVRVARRNTLCALSGPLIPAEGAVRDWQGTVEKLDATNDGRGVLTVRITPRLSLGTTNNAISEAVGPRR